jgi:ASC-1-like (ASCH) protein
MEHELKCYPSYFDAMKRGEKNFEVRRDDRGFQRGDTLQLRRFEQAYGTYTGDRLYKKITFILTGGQLGIEPGFVVMALVDIGTQ